MDPPVRPATSPEFHSLEKCKSIEDALKGTWGSDLDCTYSLTYNLEWDGEYLKDRLFRGETLGDIFTITGNIFNAKGSTIKEYVEARWGQHGTILLDHIGSQYPTKDSFTLHGNYNTHMNYAAAAAWICSAVRRSTSKLLSVSRTSIYRSDARNASPSLHFKPEMLQSTTPDYQKSCCWNPLFQGMVIVDDPSFEPGSMKGIEISFEWIIHFTGGRVIQYGESDVAIVGKGILLYTVQQDRDRIQMHLHNPEGLEACSTRNSVKIPRPIRILQPRHIKGVRTLSRSSPSSENITNILLSKVFYIGWAEYARINFGSKLILAENVGFSGENKIDPTGSYIGMGTTTTFHTATVWSIAAAINVTRYGTPRNISTTIDPDDVLGSLDHQKHECSILFNAATNTGYLIPVIRLYLFLAQIYILRYERKDIEYSRRYDAARKCLINADPDGVEAVIERIRDLLREDEVNYKLWKEERKKLKASEDWQALRKTAHKMEGEQIFLPGGEVRWNVLFAHILKSVQNGRQRTAEALNTRPFQYRAPGHITGPELLDICNEAPLSRIVSKKIQANWTDIAIFAETATFFYSDLSPVQPINASPRPPLLTRLPLRFNWYVPPQESEEYLSLSHDPLDGLCWNCRRPPPDKNLLVTTGFCIDRLLTPNTKVSADFPGGKSRFAEYTDWIPWVRLVPDMPNLLIPHRKKSGWNSSECYNIQCLRRTKLKAAGQPHLLQAVRQHHLNSGFIFGNERGKGPGAVSKGTRLDKAGKRYLQDLEDTRRKELKFLEEKRIQNLVTQEHRALAAWEKKKVKLQQRVEDRGEREARERIVVDEEARKEGYARKKTLQEQNALPDSKLLSLQTVARNWKAPSSSGENPMSSPTRPSAQQRQRRFPVVTNENSRDRLSSASGNSGRLDYSREGSLTPTRQRSRRSPDVNFGQPRRPPVRSVQSSNPSPDSSTSTDSSTSKHPLSSSASQYQFAERPPHPERPPPPIPDDRPTTPIITEEELDEEEPRAPKPPLPVIF
ncbi:hypothetical protein B7494_g4215 [Chlorociboria aeruginascens]|nr:hypothetical protein B7494_g4215 [Chlorociboria aeruginascens]